jgi:hypothetical protein
MARAGRTQRLGVQFWRGSMTALTFLGEGNLTGVATAEGDAQYIAGGDASFQGVGTLEVEASRVAGPEEPLQLIGVATLEADATVSVAEPGATLSAVATVTADATKTSAQIARRQTFVQGRVRRGSGRTHVSRSRQLLQPGEVQEAEATLQAVATFTSDASRVAGAELLATAVATLSAEGEVVAGASAEALLQAVATLEAEASPVTHDAESILVGVAALTAEAGGEIRLGEALLQGVAHMGFDPEHQPRPVHWFRRDPHIPGRVKGRMETSGRTSGVR